MVPGSRDALNASADAVAAPIEDPEPWRWFWSAACIAQAVSR
ncbi:UNVERIFIED_CONTAM: hypothetical protein RKD50_008671 [Streptomyces canus]|jgi:hypothetical protein